MSDVILILEEEPLSNALVKWASWMAVMVIFVMVLIYFSNYFSREHDECFIANEYNTNHTLQDIKNKKWKQRFDQTDTMTYI